MHIAHASYILNALTHQQYANLHESLYRPIVGDAIKYAIHQFIVIITIILSYSNTIIECALN